MAFEHMGQIAGYAKITLKLKKSQFFSYINAT